MYKRRDGQRSRKRQTRVPCTGYKWMVVHKIVSLVAQGSVVGQKVLVYAPSGRLGEAVRKTLQRYAVCAYSIHRCSIQPSNPSQRLLIVWKSDIGKVDLRMDPSFRRLDGIPNYLSEVSLTGLLGVFHAPSRPYLSSITPITFLRVRAWTL